METDRAKHNVLARIRAAQQRSAQSAPAEREAANQTIDRHARGPCPPTPDDRLAQFCQQSEARAATCRVLPSLADVPRAVAEMCQAVTGGELFVWPGLGSLDWRGARLDALFSPPRRDVGAGLLANSVGVTSCFCAIAETGSVVLLSGPDEWMSTTLLPESHVVVVLASRIVGHMEDAFALVRQERPNLPRTVSIISGPSRTGDIEQTIVLGAHGPRRVHVLVVSGA